MQASEVGTISREASIRERRDNEALGNIYMYGASPGWLEHVGKYLTQRIKNMLVKQSTVKDIKFGVASPGGNDPAIWQPHDAIPHRRSTPISIISLLVLSNHNNSYKYLIGLQELHSSAFISTSCSWLTSHCSSQAKSIRARADSETSAFSPLRLVILTFLSLTVLNFTKIFSSYLILQLYEPKC
jgi:hypothetical protein